MQKILRFIGIEWSLWSIGIARGPLCKLGDYEELLLDLGIEEEKFMEVACKSALSEGWPDEWSKIHRQDHPHMCPTDNFEFWELVDMLAKLIPEGRPKGESNDTQMEMADK